MKVKEFIEKVEKEHMRFSDCVVRQYIPYTEKVKIIDALIQVLTYDAGNMITYDTNNFNMNKEIRMIKAYTSLEFEDTMNEYDLLLSQGWIEYIFKEIGCDIERFNNMVENQLSDLIRDNNSLESIVNYQLGLVVDSIASSVDTLNVKISEADTKKLSSIVATGFKNINELIAKTEK